MMLTRVYIWLGSAAYAAVGLRLLRTLSLRRRMLLSQGIPQVGGIALGASFVGALIFDYFYAGGLPREVLGIIASSSLMLVFGIIDDYKALSVGLKFLTQFAATALLVWCGVKTKIIYIGPFVNTAVTFVWIIGITNAFNHLDVMDGLSGGVALITSAALGAIAFLNHDIYSFFIALLIVGTTLVFLCFNYPPAKVYLGNSGSHFLGFLLGSLAILISYAPVKREVALLAPVIILGLPIFDTGFLIVTRLRNKRSAFLKSGDHFALRLLKQGNSVRASLRYMLLLAATYASLGVLLSQVSNPAGIGIIVFAVLISFILLRRVGAITVDA
ncbi:MAG: MraY family glycosyltransferase [Candidatus Omnitrophica bacterium]|nr:MraY family glycosyltransferase [Candidatus Omnitrophota bacterium]